jgi:hypothetical protein
MMDAVTLSLESWLRRCTPAAGLDFGAPAQAVPEVGPEGVIRAFLYDVREDLNSRGGDLYLRDPSHKVVGHMQPLRVFQYSYQLTAWARGWQQCYGLLGDVLREAAACPVIPAELLHASLGGFRSGAVRLVVAPPSPVPFPWNASHSPISPMLNLQVLAPLQPAADTALEQAPSTVDMGMGTRAEVEGPSQRRVVRPRKRIEE